MRLPWYLSSFISTVTFVVATLVIFHAWTIDNPNLLEKLSSIWSLPYLFNSAAVSFLLASVQSIILSQDRKVLSLFATWLLIATLFFAITW